ncbi:PAS domain-containing sensor histidine kinase [Mucilaginibacter sp.]
MYHPTLQAYKAIVESSPYPVYLCMGQDMIIALANKATLKAWGKDESVLGKPISEALPELKDQPFENLLKQVYLTGEAFYSKDHRADIEINGTLKTFYFNFSYQPFRDDEYKVSGVFCFATDVTDMVVANKAVEEGKRNLNNLIMQAPVAMCIIKGSPFKADIFNDPFLELTARTRADFESRLYWEVLSEAAKVYSPIADEVIKTGIAFHGKNHKVPLIKNGVEDIRTIDFVYEPIKNEDDIVYAIMIICFDVTEIKSSEEKSAMLAAIVDSTEDAIISKTLDGYITSWNKAAENLFGYTSNEMIGQSISKIIPADRSYEEVRILERLNNGERVEHYETKRVRKNNQSIDISLTISPIKDSAGSIIGISKIARDISEKKQEEQRKNDFLNIASHELKTPLTSVRAYVQLLLAKTSKDEDKFLYDSLSRVEKQIKRMTALAHNILDNSMFQQGRFELEMKPFELQHLLNDIINDAKLMSPNHQFKLLNSEDMHILGDQNRIGQVMENLISNSIKYSPLDTAITIDYQKINGFAKISVSDEGVGISKDDQNKLFQRFYRVSNEKIKNVSGFGIGLFLVAEILEAHKSKIFLDSEENIGSTFSFALPLAVNNDTTGEEMLLTV